jgi:hypothetical protein
MGQQTIYNDVRIKGILTMDKAANGVQVALTDAVSINTDASLGNAFSVTLAGNRTLANPTNLVTGSTYIWRIVQDATGSRTLVYGSLFTWPGGSVPTLSTAAGATDVISAYYDGSKLRANAQLAFA